MNTDTLKSWFWLLLNVFLVGIILNLFLFVMPTLDRFKESLVPMRTLAVSAEGKTTVVPDLAQLSLSVVSRGLNPEDLARTNNEKMNSVIRTVKEQGVEDGDIKTTGYDLSPNYEYDESRRTSYISGYTLTQTVRLKIRDLPKVASVLSAVTPLGVNQIGGIVFTVDDPETALRDARADAFAKAREKASTMAAQSGARLGRLVNVNEHGPVMPYYLKQEAAFGRGGADMAQAVPAPSIQPGSEEVTVTVSLTYAIE
jgi:uncharacterized protein